MIGDVYAQNRKEKRALKKGLDNVKIGGLVRCIAYSNTLNATESDGFRLFFTS